MLRKFNTHTGLLSMEETVIVEGAPEGLDVPDAMLFNEVIPGELPTEAKDILVYFSEDKAKEIAEGGPQLALESFWNLLSDIESVRASVRSEGGVSQSMALECERLMPGFLTDDYPIQTFSKIATRTNYTYTAEAFDVKSAAIIGAIIAIILGIAKLMFGSGGSSGSGGAADKVDDKIDQLKDTVAKTGQAAEKAKQAGVTPADANKTSFKPHNLPKGDPLESRIEALDAHCAKGLNGLQTFGLGLSTTNNTQGRAFWDMMGRGNYTDAVITLGDCFEVVSTALKHNITTDGVMDRSKIDAISKALFRCYAKMKGLKLFNSVHFDPNSILQSEDAATAFFKSDPTKEWVTAFTILKGMTDERAYQTLLHTSVATAFWESSKVFHDDFETLSKGRSERKRVNTDMGHNVTVVMPQIQQAFKTAYGNQSHGDPAALAASESMFMPVRQALKLCEFILEVLRNLSHIFHDLTQAVNNTALQVEQDIGTLAAIKAFEAKPA
jgi:hypothetical protein